VPPDEEQPLPLEPAAEAEPLPDPEAEEKPDVAEAEPEPVAEGEPDAVAGGDPEPEQVAEVEPEPVPEGGDAETGIIPRRRLFGRRRREVAAAEAQTDSPKHVRVLPPRETAVAEAELPAWERGFDDTEERRPGA